MERLLRHKLIFASLLLLLAVNGWAQAPLLWGGAPSQDSLWGIDTTTWSVMHRRAPSMAGFAIDGISGLAWDPVGHKTYVIARTSANNYLGTIDLMTGVITQVGNLGKKFSSLTFRADGQLLGVTEDSQIPNPETMFLINKSTAANTLAIALGGGNNGEVICFNFNDQMIYHWSGNSAMVLEKFAATAPYIPIASIPISGAIGGEALGAISLDNNKFLVSNSSAQLLRMNANGNYQGSVTTLPSGMSGLVLPPRWTLSEDTVCVEEVVNWSLMPGQIRDTAVYDWGDGTVTTVFPAGGASHVYSIAGNYTVAAMLKNSVSGLDTLVSHHMVVRALPGVGLYPFNDTALCYIDTLRITGAFGGTSRWYRNGIQIPGANAYIYTANVSGWYNMTKTNQNGCTDSAAVGISVAFGDVPAASNMVDSTICQGDSVCFSFNNPVNVSYLWSSGSTASTACITAPGPITVTASDPAGCAHQDSAFVSVILQPNPNITFDTTGCPLVTFEANDLLGTAYVWDFGDGGVGSGPSVSHTYAAGGIYTVTLAESNACTTITRTVIVPIHCLNGIDDALAGAIHLAPNPSQGLFELRVTLSAPASLSYEITDLSGRLLLARSFADASGDWSDAIQFEAARGMYFITVKVGDTRGSYRLLIE